jgi:D-alanyl-D-alanine carboxypeptidase
VLVAGLLLCCLGVAAVPPQWAVDTLAGKPYMRHASLGVAVMDIATGEMVAGHDVDCSEITASTMKTVASLTALETLGADYRFATPVWTCGKVDRDETRFNKSVIRKQDANGKYIDTNNSTNDFTPEAPASLLNK